MEYDFLTKIEKDQKMNTEISFSIWIAFLRYWKMNLRE